MAVTHRELAELSEQHLVESHRNGDDEAFDNIVRRYQPGLLAHARRRLGSQQAAEDAVQETLLRAYRALPRFNGEYRLGNWLHRILRNVCTDEANRRRRHLAVVDRIRASEPACAHEAVPADQVALSRDRRSDVVRALDELPESYRTAFVLRAVEELPYDEVAMACGISEDNARARVSRARSVLRRSTARFGAFVSVLGVTVRRGRVTGTHGIDASQGTAAAGGAPSAASAAPGATSVATSATSATSAAGAVVAGPTPAALHLTTAIHDIAPAVGAAGRAVAVLASAAAVLVPAALSSSSSSDNRGATPDRARGELAVTDAPEVAGAARPPVEPSTTLVATDATVAASTSTSVAAVPARRIDVTFHHLALRPDGDAWTVGGEVAIQTADGLLLGDLEPYSHLSLAPDNGWGARRVDLIAFVSLDDGRALTLRVQGLATGEPPAPTTTSTTATTVSTAPPIVTTTTVPGDRLDPEPELDLPPTVTVTTAPPVATNPRPARYGPLPSGHYDLSGSAVLNGGDALGLFGAGGIGGVLDLLDGSGTLQLAITERR